MSSPVQTAYTQGKAVLKYLQVHFGYLFSHQFLITNDASRVARIGLKIPSVNSEQRIAIKIFRDLFDAVLQLLHALWSSMTLFRSLYSTEPSQTFLFRDVVLVSKTIPTEPCLLEENFCIAGLTHISRT
jgi:hypothetical protein